MIDDTHDDDIYLYPLEEPDEYGKLKFAIADAVQQTTGYYAGDVKVYAHAQDDALVYTVQHWHDGVCDEKWIFIEMETVRVYAHDTLVKHVIDSFKLAHWDYEPPGGWQKEIKDNPPDFIGD